MDPKLGLSFDCLSFSLFSIFCTWCSFKQAKVWVRYFNCGLVTLFLHVSLCLSPGGRLFKFPFPKMLGAPNKCGECLTSRNSGTFYRVLTPLTPLIFIPCLDPLGFSPDTSCIPIYVYPHLDPCLPLPPVSISFLLPCGIEASSFGHFCLLQPNVCRLNLYFLANIHLWIACMFFWVWVT